MTMEPAATNRNADVAIILTLHAEGRTLLPTVHALSRAVAEATAAGIRTEIVAVFDRADPATVLAWQSISFDQDLSLGAPPVVIETNHGDLGLARMAGITASSAALIGVLDADNLPTPNWIRAAVQALAEHPQPAVAHPALILTFDAKREMWPLFSSEAPEFRPGTMMWFNPWDAFAIAPREIFESHPYREFRPGAGFGPEDWTWNCETIAAGVPHIIVPGTALFYRKKPDGSLAEAHGNSLLPRNELLTSKAIARAEIGALTATMQARAQPDSPVADDVVSRLRRSSLAQRVRRQRAVDIGVRGARYLARPIRNRLTLTPPPAPHPHPELLDAQLRAYWADAHQVQPRIPYPSDAVLGEYGLWGKGWDEEFVPDRLAYWSAIEALPDRPDIVFFAPWIGTGGADLLATQYMNALCRLRPNAKVVLITTEPRPSTRLDLLDPRITVFDLGAFELYYEFAVRIIAMLMVQLRPEVIHVVNSTAAYHAVEWFGAALTAHTRVFLSTYVVDQKADGGNWSFLFHRSRDFFDLVSRVITDNSRIAERAVAFEGVPAEKILVHHQVVDECYLPHAPATFGSDRPVRLAWIGRFDLQKRLDRLASIAESLAQRGVPFTLDVYGESVLNDDPTLPASRQRLLDAGARLHPAYTGGFSSIDPAQVDALIVTSQDEGTPNVVLEAMSSGVPVIAPAVGDIPRLVGERTGFLVAHPDEIDEYVQALLSLTGDHASAIARAASARRLVEREYSHARLDETLQALDGYLPEENRGSADAPRGWHWYATPDTRALLSDGSVGVLIYTGSNGTSNFGDVLQTKNVVRYWQERTDEPPVLMLPLSAAQPTGRHEQLQRWLGVQHIVYFEPTLSGTLDPELAPIRPDRLDVLLHVVGGGYLNARFGAEHFAAIDAVADEFSVRGIVSSGLQIDATAVPALHALAGRHELVCVGVRDEMSLQLAESAGLPAEYTFDDLSEVLQSWAPSPDAPRSDGSIVIHLNTSDYVGGDSARTLWAEILAQLAARRPRRVVILSAYADRRNDVRDALRSIADLAEDFPFTTFEVIDIAQVSLHEDVRGGLPQAVAALSAADFAVTSSYHTALFLTSQGVPSYLVSANAYFAQKAGLFRLPSFAEFLDDPKAHLLDLAEGFAARRRWVKKLNRIS